MNQFLDYWEFNYERNQSITSSYKRKFSKLVSYLRKNYTKNTNIWSTRDVPTRGNNEKFRLFIHDTNGPESLHRALNRIIHRGGSQYSVGTIGGFVHTFFTNIDEKVELLKTNTVKNELNKFHTVSIDSFKFV